MAWVGNIPNCRLNAVEKCDKFLKPTLRYTLDAGTPFFNNIIASSNRRLIIQRAGVSPSKVSAKSRLNADKLRLYNVQVVQESNHQYNFDS